MLKARSLLVAALAGLLLFVYVFLINNQQMAAGSMLEIIKAIILVCASIILVDILSFILINVWFVTARNKQPSDLLKLVVSVLLYAICAFIVFRLLGRDITALAATSALLGAILGFALQTPLGNFLSGIFLQFDQPFHVGDRIQVQGYEGVITTIDWRTTDIRLDSGEMVHIPNGAIANDSIVVITTEQPIYRTIDFVAPATAPPNQVIEVACSAVQNQAHPNVNPDQPVFVKMWSYSLSDVQYRLFYYPKRYDAAAVHTDPDLLRRIWYALSRAGFGNNYTSNAANQTQSLIAAIEFFRPFSTAAQRQLLEQSKTLIFDAEEALGLWNLPPQSMFLVVKGGISIDQELVPKLGVMTVKTFSLRPKNQTTVTLSQKSIDRAATHLAHHLGPVAFSLADQAAETASSAYWLYQNLATEILDPNDRQEFLSHQPRVPTEQFGRGDCFGEMSLFLSRSLPLVKMMTTEETEVLAITPTAVIAALKHDNRSITELSQQVARYHTANLRGTLQAFSTDQLSEQQMAEQIQQNFAADLNVELRDTV
ncbi:MAG: mechanosensitive ion channel family protein [Thainema sp.]